MLHYRGKKKFKVTWIWAPENMTNRVSKPYYYVQLLTKVTKEKRTVYYIAIITTGSQLEQIDGKGKIN